MERLECRPAAPAHAAAYLAFAATQFGVGTSAANDRYLRWLYEQNPFGGSWTDALLAFATSGEVVGCMHSMRIPWRVNGESCVVPTVHNLMVSPEHRQGIGMKMVLTMLPTFPLSVVPAAVGPLASMYRRLGCTQIESHWYRRALKPLRAGCQFGAQKLFGWQAAPRYFPATTELTRLPSAHGDACWTTSPTTGQLEQLAECLNQDRGDASGPEFSPEFLFWRFFHPLAPRHAVVWQATNGRLTDAAILSLGLRKGFNVGRIITARAGSAASFAALIQQAEHVLKQLGATLLFAFSASPSLNRTYQSIGWKAQADGPPTFLSAKRFGQPITVSFSGEAIDIGFEAMSAAEAAAA